MLMIKSNAAKKRILSYVLAFRDKQNQLDTDDSLIYSIVPIGLAVKHNVLIPEFLLHPMLLKRRMFHELVEFVTVKEQLVKLISQVLEAEFEENGEQHLPDEAFRLLVKAHTRLTKSKKNANVKKL